MNMLKDNSADWLATADEYINYYDYSELEHMQHIGTGASGSIELVKWKNAGRLFALKSFNNKQTLKEVVKELKLHRIVANHDNILRLYGITKTETGATYQKYSLVLEYADNGTLYTYLNKHFDELGWSEKYQLADQLTSAVEYIHDYGIIHRDLHAKNILIHQKNVKLADFGLSKKITEASSDSKVLGMIPYVDPKSFNKDRGQNYKLNKESDVYSIGVLLWQISSGRQPFYDEDNNYDVGLALDILNGKREEIIDGTHIDYSNLYEECWKLEPNERPRIQEVVLTLKTIISPEQNNKDIDVNREEKISLEKSKSSTPLSSRSLISIREIIDININLSISSGLNSIESGNVISSQNQNSVQLSIMEVESGSSSSLNSLSSFSTSNQVTEVTNSLIDDIYKMISDRLITFIIEKHNGGITFNQIQQLLSKQILQINQDTDELMKWLSKNQDKSPYIWFLGLFYYYNIICVEENDIKAFELFSKAAKAASYNYPIAQVYLARCYHDGYGIDHDKKKAFYWYQKSANNGSNIGRFYLGICYEFGIGTVENERESVYWYGKADENGNTTAKLYLANCYRLGKGIEKDENKAFKYYKILAKKRIVSAQQQLGNCLYYGIGTTVDKELAFYWYNKATTNGNIVAKKILKKINKTNEIKLYKILLLKNLSQRGLYYIEKLIIVTNSKKPFHYIQKAAENGCRFAQFNLGKCYQLGKGIRKSERKAFEWYKKSAEQGYINAQAELGCCYYYGFGIETNKVEAVELFKITADEGNGHAQFHLGTNYQSGKIIDKNEGKAFKYYIRSAKKGYSAAQNNLAILYKDGKGTKKDLRKAIYWFKKAVGNGSEVAQYNLGKCYELGTGVKENKIKAFELFKKSAEQDDANAKFQLGNCYREGVGTEINEINAFESYREAAKKGNINAQCALGDCYKEGIGTEVNKEYALVLYKIAAERGHIIAQYNLAQCYMFGDGVEKDEDKAFEYYKQSADQEFYFNGIETEVSKRKAFELHKMAAEKGHNIAQLNLGQYYRYGEEVVKNEVEYYKKSADQRCRCSI